MQRRKLILGVGSLLVLGGLTYFYGLMAPREAVLGQLKALSQGSITKAYYGYTSENFQKRRPIALFKEEMERAPLMLNHTSVDLIESAPFGGRAIVRIEGKEGEELAAIYRVTFDKGQWKVDDIETIQEPEETKKMFSLLEEHLTELKRGNLKGAWSKHFAKSFKESVSAKNYKAALSQHPILTEWNQVALLSQEPEGEYEKLTLELRNGKRSSYLDAWVKEDEGKLRIFALEVEPEEESSIAEAEEKAPVAQEKSALQLVEKDLNSFFKAVKEGELKGAYEGTASDFKKASSLQDFENYFKDNAVFKSFNSVSISENEFKGNEGFIRGLYLTQEGKNIPFEARFVEESGVWKLLGIHFEIEDTEIKIQSVTFGTELALDGQLINPRDNFTPEDRKIIARVLVDGGVKGEKATFTLEHEQSKSRIPPISLVFTKDGTEVIDVTFSSPSSGWPVGDYNMLIETSQGAKETVHFTVSKSVP